MRRLSRSSGDAPIEPAGISWFATAYAAVPQASDVLDAVYDRIERAGERPLWITVLPRAEAQAMLALATARREAGEHLPLLGVPFAVKDNIDVAGLPTTAGCPDFSYWPERSAQAVEMLVAAGAVPVGKTNLDQFATGLSGTRSPYGIPASVFDATRVSGGSSSGSAVAVASGLVAFALGTDTAGSGRVPAAFNNIVGLKPTKGLVSTRGIVPACRSQDCVSVFAGTVGDALAVARVASGFDPDDPFSRAAPDAGVPTIEPPPGWRFGVPGVAALADCDEDGLALFEAAAARLEAFGGTRTEIDFAPFRDAAGLLYAGPWVAERLAAIKRFAADRPDSIHPVVREIILAGSRFSAVEAFEGQYRLAALTRLAEREWAKMDVMLLPTAPFVPTIQAVLDDPIGLNTRLGLYTNFVNLMDLSALAVPAGFTSDGLPFGVTLVGRTFQDGELALIGDRLHRALAGATLGRSGAPFPSSARVEPEQGPRRVLVAVVGAHLTGQPLNGQLTGRGGRLVATTRTAPGYSLHALPGTAPPKPGLVRDGGMGGVEVEVWSLPIAGFGAFVAEIPPPLGIGTVSLADGSDVKGFLCEPHALRGAQDITGFGGWRAYLGAGAPDAVRGVAPQSSSQIPEEVSP